jgi:ADP-ribose pyrophosphatase
LRRGFPADCRNLYHTGLYDELITIFLATGLTQNAAAPDDDEFVNVVWKPLDGLYQMALAGEIEDSKTLIALLLAKDLLQ